MTIILLFFLRKETKSPWNIYGGYLLSILKNKKFGAFKADVSFFLLLKTHFLKHNIIYITKVYLSVLITNLNEA